LLDVEIKRFADGECYVRVKEDVKKEDVIIVQTTYPDNNIIELILLRDALLEADAGNIYLIIPYFGYARQDKKFKDGEPISAKALAEIFSMCVEAVITVDPHKEYILDFFKVPAFSCSAVPEIAGYLANKNVDVILAPDKGAIDRAKNASNVLGCEYDFLEKTRIDDKTIEIKPKEIDVEGKTVAIIDDIISTGGTMARAVSEMINQGAEKVYVACTHGLFVNGAIKKLTDAGCDEIISTDTIENRFSKVGVAPQIAAAMSRAIK
ncbi:MAG TPA: ribose-phosphate diphosphokinase, partial [Thermoplasmatales archaeon]|nr:ribose-phosphate diphosphokinase [Thermoplasmatales archaeon]